MLLFCRIRKEGLRKWVAHDAQKEDPAGRLIHDRVEEGPVRDELDFLTPAEVAGILRLKSVKRVYESEVPIRQKLRRVG